MPSTRLFVLSRESTRDAAETEAFKHAVEPQGTEKTIDDATESKAGKKASDEVEHTCEQQSDGGQDLAQRLGQQCPKWVQVLLGVWHVGNLLLGVLNTGNDGARKLIIC